MKKSELRGRVRLLRSRGRTYSEIVADIGLAIPKSTLSYWCRGVRLSNFHKKRIDSLVLSNLSAARGLSLQSRARSREQYFASIYKKNQYFDNVWKDEKLAKLTLAMLYLGEGKKKMRGSLMFGNSDPRIIALFLGLLRFVYRVEEGKLRCTVQCRADQNTSVLEQFWRQVTRIPAKQFYKTRVDQRTIGRASRKKNYKGVCRLDYFSANVYHELTVISDIICSDFKGLW